MSKEQQPLASKEIIKLLEKVRFELPTLSMNIPTRKLIGEVIDHLLEQQPTASEFTAKVRQKVNSKDGANYLRLGEVGGWPEISKDILELCARLDRAEAKGAVGKTAPQSGSKINRKR